MRSAKPSLFARNDTMFGVCEGLGQDFGFNPNWLRVMLPLPLFLYPVETIAAYATMGVIVFVVHMLVPDHRADTVPATPVDEPAAIASEEAHALPLAA